MSDNNNNVRRDVVLPRLELDRVKERFKDDNSVQIINELFSNDSLRSSSSNHSSQFSPNLSIPQEPELGMNRLISSNYEDISINQIKNRMLKKHCFSMVPVNWNSEEEYIRHSNSSMSIENYFKERLKHRLEIPGIEKNDPIEKGKQNSTGPYTLRMEKSSKKIMEKFKSKLQSLIKSHEEESSLTFKSNSNRSDLSSGKNRQELKLANATFDLDPTKSSIDNKAIEKHGTKLISVEDLSKNSKPVFNKKATLNKNTVLKVNSFKSFESEKEIKCEKINTIQGNILDNKSKNLSLESINIEEKGNCRLISKTVYNHSNLIPIDEKELNQDTKGENNEKSAQKVDTLERDNTVKANKLDETNIFRKNPSKTSIIKSSPGSQMSNDKTELANGFKENYNLPSETSSENIKNLKDELDGGVTKVDNCLINKNEPNCLKLTIEKNLNVQESKNQGNPEEKNELHVNKVFNTEKLKLENSKCGEETKNSNVPVPDGEKVKDGHIVGPEENIGNKKNKNEVEIKVDQIKECSEGKTKDCTNSKEINDEKPEGKVKDIMKEKNSVSRENNLILEKELSSKNTQKSEDIKAENLAPEKLADHIIKDEKKVLPAELKNRDVKKTPEFKVKKNSNTGESTVKVDINSKLGEISGKVDRKLNSESDNIDIKEEIRFQDELRLKVEERESLKKIFHEDKSKLEGHKSMIKGKTSTKVSNEASLALKQESRQKSTTDFNSLLSKGNEVSTIKAEPIKNLEQKKDSTLGKKALGLKEAEPSDELIQDNKLVNINFIPKIPAKQNQLKNFNGKYFQNETKMLSFGKSTAKDQSKALNTIYELDSTSTDELKKEKSDNLGAKLNPQENVKSKELVKQKNVTIPKSTTNVNKHTETKVAKISVKNVNINSLCPAKKDAEVLNKQSHISAFKEENDQESSESGLKILNTDSLKSKNSCITSTKGSLEKKNKNESPNNHTSVSDAIGNCEKVKSVTCQKPVDQTFGKDTGLLPQKSEGKNILKGKWNEIINDRNKSKIFSCKKKNDQPQKVSNEENSNKIVKEAKRFKDNSSVKKDASEVNSFVKTGSKEIISNACLKKIITLDDCVGSEIVKTRDNKIPVIKESLMGSDSSISFKGDKIQKPLLNQKKRAELRSHLAAPEMQYRIYNITSHPDPNCHLIRGEAKQDECQGSAVVPFSPFRGIFNKLCDMFVRNHKESKDVYNNDINLDNEIHRTRSIELEIKPFMERRSFTNKNFDCQVNSNKGNLDLSEQHSKIYREKIVRGQENTTRREPLIAIEKLLSSDFSSVEQNNKVYRKSSTLSRVRMESNNLGRVAKRVPRKKIANRNIHNVLEINKNCIKTPRNERIDNVTNKTLKINLMENILRSEHQISPIKSLKSNKLTRIKDISQESEIGASTMSKYEDVYIKNRARRNYVKLLKSFVNFFDEKNSITGSSCSCHICSRHNIDDGKVDPITLHIIREENKLREIKHSNTMVNNNEKFNSYCNFPKHYHKHYHYSGTKSLKQEKKHKKSGCKHKSMSKRKHKCRHHEKYYRAKSKKCELDAEESVVNCVISENIHKQKESKKIENNIYDSNDFAQLKGQIELILKEYGVINKGSKPEVNSGVHNCNISIEKSEISALKNILLDTNKLLSQSIRNTKEAEPPISEKKWTGSEVIKREESNIPQEKLHREDSVSKIKQDRQLEILRLPSNKLEKTIIRRNMMRMKLDLDNIWQGVYKAVNTKMERKYSKNRQRITKGRRSVPNIIKTNTGLENSDLNSLGSLKTVRKSILKSSKQQSETNSKNSSWFSSWFGYSTPTTEAQENTNNKLTSEKEPEASSQAQVKKTAPKSSSSPKAKQANFPPPPTPVQNDYVENKLNSNNYFSSSQSDTRATKATSNEDESLNIDDFMDNSDLDVSLPKNDREEGNKLEDERCIFNDKSIEVEDQNKKQENSFWGWFGYSTTPEKPAAKAKTAKTAQKNISKNGQHKVKRKTSRQLHKGNTNINTDNCKAENISPHVPPVEEKSWFSSWFGGGTDTSPPPPTPVAQTKDKQKQKWSPPPPLDPIESSPYVQTPGQNIYYQEAQQPPPPPPTPAPAEESSWFSGWFGGTAEPTKENNSQKEIKSKAKSFAKSKNSRKIKDNPANGMSGTRLPSIKVSPAPESTPPSEKSSWFGGWFGTSETTPAPPPTPVATTNTEQINTPVADSFQAPDPPPPPEETSWFGSWFTATPEPSPKQTPQPSPKKSNKMNSSSKTGAVKKNSKHAPAPPNSTTEATTEPINITNNDYIQTPNPPTQTAPPAEESSWFSSWFGTSETTPAPPPTPTMAVQPEPTSIPNSNSMITPTSSTPQPQSPPPAEESSWFSSWFGSSETTPTPPPTPTAAERPALNNTTTTNVLQVPSNNQHANPTPMPAEESSWFGEWLGGSSEPTPSAPPPTPSGAQESSWFSGFGW